MTALPEAVPATPQPGEARGAGARLRELTSLAFPTAAPCPRRRASRASSFGAYLAGFAVLAGIALARQPGVPATRTFWAEDGVIFYAQALGKPFGADLVAAYNGYDQLVPRLVVELTRLAPARDAATVVALAGAGALAGLGCAVFDMARGHVPAPALRVLLVLAMVLLPVANFEMLDNLVNLPWWMFFAAFWALLWRPCRRTGALGSAVLCALAAASEPLVGLLLPLAALRALTLRGWRDRAAAAGLAAGLVFQGLVVMGAKGGRDYSSAGLGGVPGAFLTRVGLAWLTGRKGTSALVGWDQGAAEALGALLVVVLIGAAWELGNGNVRALAVSVAVLAPVCFAVPVWARGAAPFMQSARSFAFAGRYAAVPVLMLVSLLLALAGSLGAHRAAQGAGLTGPGAGVAGPPWERPRDLRLPATVVACCLLLPAWVVDFRDPNGRMHGPTWESQLAAASASCRSARSNGLVTVEATPPGMSFVLHCRAIGLGHGRAGTGRAQL